MIPGADMSQIQGVMSAATWERFDRAWVYLRLEQGTGALDTAFDTNLTSARAAGVKAIGAYCVFIPGENPAAQARAWFAACDGLGSKGDGLPIAVDFEVASKTLTPAQEVAALVVTVQTLRELGGRFPVLYSYPDFEVRMLSAATAEQLAVLAECPLWQASYGAEPPDVPKPWTRILLWQKSGGTNGYRAPDGAPCDDDVFLGTQEELDALVAFVKPIADPLAGVPVPGLEIPGMNV